MMTPRVLLNPLPMLLLAWCGTLHSANRACGVDWDFVPEAKGRVEVAVERGNMNRYYRLTQAESVAFDQSLQKTLDVVLAQPHLRPPRGTHLSGWLRQWSHPLCDARDKVEPCLGVPVTGQGTLQFYYLRSDGAKVYPTRETPYDADLSVNLIESAHSGGGGAEIADLGFHLQLAQHAEIDGVPVFKNPATQTAIMVLARSGRPPWSRPVSQQEYLQAAIQRLESEVQEDAALRGAVPQTDAPAADRQRAWQREAAARQLEARKLVEETRRSNPALADTLRRNFEQLEAEMAAAMRKDVDIERQKAALAAGHPAPPKALTLADRLLRHRERLAAMLPAERQAQAFFMSAEDPLDPPLAPAGKETQGYPLVRPNPAYFDSKLPRTAVQFITLSFGMAMLGPITPDECGALNPGYVALWQTIHQTPWQQIRSLLAP